MGTSQYPRIGYRLAPRCLQEILDVPVSDSQIEPRLRVNLRCSELDETSWGQFSTRTCRKLAQMIVRKTGAQIRSFPKKVLIRRLPLIPCGIQIDHLDLAPRTRNCLRQMMWNANLARLDELNKLTIGQILHTSGFGARSLVDLLTSLEGVAIGKDQVDIVEAEDKKQNNDEPALHLDGCLTKEAARLKQIPDAQSVRLDDPRLARHLREIFRYANTIGNGVPLNTQVTIVDMANRIANRRCDPANLIALCAQTRALRRHIALLSRAPLEEELRRVTAPIKGYRAVKIFLRYQGWDGGGSCTMHAAGAEFGITGSGAQQICAYFCEQLGTKTPYLPCLEKTLAFVKTLLPAPACEIELALKQQRLTEKNFRLEGLLRAASFFKRPALFRIETVNRTRMAIPEEAAGITLEITRVATESIVRWGLATLGDVVDQIKDNATSSVSPEFISKVLQSRQDFKWLNQENNWFWLSSVRHNPLVNLIRKVISVSARIDVKEIMVAISRSIRSSDSALPGQVLLELCRQLPVCNVRGETVSASESIKPQGTICNSEFLMFRILKDKGPLLRWGTYQTFCLAAGMSESTFNRIIRRSPIIARYGAGIYGIIGATCPPARSKRSRVNAAHEQILSASAPQKSQLASY